ncbi:MAG: PglZ domain-containing protein [Bacteroidales bacterium]|jgi:hypothetical protein|nr:PglZ domain-containing protein [Bacteroidales bacterium]
MAKELLKHIINDIKSRQKQVILVENNDKFLFRADVIDVLEHNGFKVSIGSNIKQRVDYELLEEGLILLILCQDKPIYLEDISNNSITIEFFLGEYLNGYDIPTVINLDMPLLEQLYSSKQIYSLSKKESESEVARLREVVESNAIDINEFKDEISIELSSLTKDWSKICQLLSGALLRAIGTKYYDEVFEQINRCNLVFQEEIKLTYSQLKNSSSIKKPKIVSKILDYLNSNYKNEKLALIVVDGMAYWQYELLKSKIAGQKKEDIIYSWIPSITQLSRQAIFRGKAPLNDYIQNPGNEIKLWKEYWKSIGLADYQLKYEHEKIDLLNIESITKFAIVYSDLDKKMHGSTDYKDLLANTENWIDRSKIVTVIDTLLSQNFKLFLTTDHGNIQARGWRGLKGREKLGTNKSGSRSQRHLEYSDQWLSDEFMESNPDLAGSVVQDEQAIYFKNDQSFAKDDSLVTHGGSHLLEVLIPFIEITNEK